jgi:hypothetical protein
MKANRFYFLMAMIIFFAACSFQTADLRDCTTYALEGLRKVADERSGRFLGKVEEDTARCRGGDKAVALRYTPWIDWQNYWAAGDGTSKARGLSGEHIHLSPNGRGIDGALLDLEYERIELIKFNLFDNSGTYGEYILGRGVVDGMALKSWDEMRLPKDHPAYISVGGDGPQLCQGELVRFRTLSGICNDIRNPLMGSSGQPFARNVEFDTTFPDLGKNDLVKNRHGDRLGLLKPDPQVISRKLLTRAQSDPGKCQNGQGLAGYSVAANCDYKKAPFFNTLAAFWIQFMTHDWFSHLEEGRNGTESIGMGCAKQLVNNNETPLTPEQIDQLNCRPEDRIDNSQVARDDRPTTFTHGGKEYLSRAHKITQNKVTAWWDASQLYGFDPTSRRRVKRDPADPAKFLLVNARADESMGYLPLLQPLDPMNPQWAGQEATAFPDNWSIGLSFYHNVFAREHNLFVDAFRKQAAATPDEDSGLRNPTKADHPITYREVTADELFEAARLVVSAEIAKIHTTEWTTQLLYNEPLYLGMNANWHGLLKDSPLLAKALEKIVVNNFGESEDAKQAGQWYSVFASGPGIFGLGNHVYVDNPRFAKFDPKKTDLWDLKNPDHVNGGVNHFGSPFNFPEEFVTVYRLHPLVPDLIEFRDARADPNVIRYKIPVAETVRGKATQAMREQGLANWGISMGRQRLGLLTLQNSPVFLQSLTMPRLNSSTGRIDVAALDIIRDREHGVPRFNEFRRQYGLKQLTSFDDFIDPRLPKDSSEPAEQQRLVGILREVYGQHKCDRSKIITAAQLNDDGSKINDCLGHPNGSMVDNIEDVDVIVGMLAEFARPHGFAISETQFQVFILNASRRLFSDRFFTSSFRPEFYTMLGVMWVNENGPDGKIMENGKPNRHEMEVSPLKRVLLRTIPELKTELDSVVNVFDPWARDRGDYYSLQWKPRPGAEADEAFKNR